MFKTSFPSKNGSQRELEAAVSIWTTQIVWTPGTKTFRPSCIYNAICQHTKCTQSVTRYDRIHFKTVYLWTTDKTQGMTKLSREYRLVHIDLSYIDIRPVNRELDGRKRNLVDKAELALTATNILRTKPN